ncbi:Na/Pi cotransporter family protein [Carboxylicivirga sediminis]|uniref:Na/Pi cotransporter family protein n=1 Tax=Carboxylicivirga sediminis TaxID=2006564 RepID=A0A941F689_9BACT|nr:Na/Pi cotransporter family protein [Carboxylicivirga sediminis]MBR8537262.1 Na/Pi cotransporter family protein [Carboxylicivirga sediminis]
MNYSFFDFLTLIGSLGLFLFGMKMMSEALQKVAGDRMRKILSAMTSNRFLGVLTGFLVTAIIQSSSATTVMVVSFVNAGLMSLVESIGVIMGANIGTTITGWMITLLGFKVKISAYALPMIGLGLPLIFSKNSSRRSWGEFLVGFALLFLGLEYLKGSVPNIKESPEVLSFLQNYTQLGFGSTIIFLFIGTILTVVIQSSSATMALTFVMCNQGWIPFHLAAAMVMGENIGTTITANLAAAVGNVSAKRAARVHLLFNLMGVTWMLMVFPWFVDAIDHFVSKSNGGISPSQSAAAVPTALSIFHTSFNVINVLVFIWFVPVFEKVVKRMIPASELEEEEFRLKFITTGMLSTSELSILQARKEVHWFGKHSQKMFGFIRKLMGQNKDSKFSKQFARIEKYEGICDNIEVEIANYLAQVNQGKLSDVGRKRVRSMLKLVDDLESIGDCNYNLAKTINRMRNANVKFSDEILKKLELMFNLVDEALDVMVTNLDDGSEDIHVTKAKQIENEINNYRNQLKVEHLDNFKNGVYTYEAGIIFNDLFSECEKLADYAINVTEALAEVNPQ